MLLAFCIINLSDKPNVDLSVNFWMQVMEFR